jgi:hypothetical protein
MARTALNLGVRDVAEACPQTSSLRLERGEELLPRHPRRVRSGWDHLPFILNHETIFDRLFRDENKEAPSKGAK